MCCQTAKWLLPLLITPPLLLLPLPLPLLLLHVLPTWLRRNLGSICTNAHKQQRHTSTM
jgi:hypothetical protein